MVETALRQRVKGTLASVCVTSWQVVTSKLEHGGGDNTGLDRSDSICVLKGRRPGKQESAETGGLETAHLPPVLTSCSSLSQGWGVEECLLIILLVPIHKKSIGTRKAQLWGGTDDRKCQMSHSERMREEPLWAKRRVSVRALWQDELAHLRTCKADGVCCGSRKGGGEAAASSAF